MGDVVSGLAVFAVVIAVGWALVRFGAVPAGSDTILTGVCFYAATPALLVTTIGGADLATVVSRTTLAGLLAETLGIVSAWLVHRLALRRSVAESTIGALAAGYVNAANLGIPVLIVLLGDATAIAPILLLQLLVISPAAFAVLDVSTARGAGPGPAVWTAPLRNPLLLGVVAGLVVNLTGWDAGAAAGGLVANSLSTLGALAVTLMMLSLGMSLAASSPRVTRRLTVARVTRLRATGPGADGGAGAPGAEGLDGGPPSSGGKGAPSGGGAVPGGGKGAPSGGGAVPGGGEGTPSPGGGEDPGAGGSDGGVGGPEGSTDRGERGAVLWVSVAWKLVVVPLLALGLGAALGLRGPALLVPITTAGLPSAQNVFMYATRYGAAKPLARDCVLLTTAGFVPVVLLAAALLS
ncbi:AEC family transporter [Actinomyces dentalis]|uniref:AEC family transporter n=1 Tax=Actinomyces dentalis TaxID=272548 RepID=UPI002355AA1E|nr:AEC family transporter [Actinomyces dentalis]